MKFEVIYQFNWYTLYLQLYYTYTTDTLTPTYGISSWANLYPQKTTLAENELYCGVFFHSYNCEVFFFLISGC